MSTTRILLVEDSPTQAQEYAYHLRKAGYDMNIAQDGILALNMVISYQPHVIVLDINLPILDGFQICRRVKRDKEMKHIPIVMLTSADNMNANLKGLEAGADDYIPKDEFAVENLLSTLKSLTEAIK